LIGLRFNLIQLCVYIYSGPLPELQGQKLFESSAAELHKTTKLFNRFR